MGIRVREATSRDAHRLTEITVTSLPDDVTFDYMWPHRDEFPEDNFFFWQLNLEKHMHHKSHVFLVAELVPDKEEALEKKPVAAPTIISYAIWIRHGRNAAARRLIAKKNTWLNMLDSTLRPRARPHSAWRKLMIAGTVSRLQRYSISRKYKRRDTDFARLQALQQATDEAHRDHFEKTSDFWVMELLVTDRVFRRRGAATALIQWGTNAADQGGLRCGVEASVMGAKIYNSQGFVRVETKTVPVPGQSASLDYDVMVREPRCQA